MPDHTVRLLLDLQESAYSMYVSVPTRQPRTHSAAMQPAAGVRRQASQDDEMVRSRFRAAGLLSSSPFTAAATR